MKDDLIHCVWNANATSRDGKERLLRRAGFDDGSCYEFNEAPISVLRQKKPQPPHDEIDGINLLC